MYFFFLLGFGLMNFQSSVSNDMLLHLVKWDEIFGETTLFVQLGTYLQCKDFFHQMECPLKQVTLFEVIQFQLHYFTFSNILCILLEAIMLFWISSRTAVDILQILMGGKCCFPCRKWNRKSELLAYPEITSRCCHRHHTTQRVGLLAASCSKFSRYPIPREFWACLSILFFESAVIVGRFFLSPKQAPPSL